MSKDDLFYFLILLVSIFFANYLNNLQSPSQKKLLVFTVGLSLVMLTCGYSSLHSLITVLVNLAIIKLVSPKYCHVVSFVWCFGYLSFFRLGYLLFGLPPAVSYLNAVQLLLTLKMSGLSFEVHDKHERIKNLNFQKATTTKRPDETTIRNLKTNNNDIVKDNDDGVVVDNGVVDNDVIDNGVVDNDAVVDVFAPPPVIDMLVYSFSFIGILTGPYYSFKTFNDMIECDIPAISIKHHIYRRIKYLPLIIFLFLILSYLYTLDDVKSVALQYNNSNNNDANKASTLLSRLFYMVVLFCTFRMRMYTAWLLSETVCTSAKLGMYPIECESRCGGGPTKIDVFDDWKKKSLSEKLESEFDFETTKNLDVKGCELCTTLRQGMKCWNMTVQYWLATNVYKRLNFIKSNRIRAGLTMLVSAYWHGVHPGYYLSFLLVPFYILAEDFMIHAFKLTSISKNSVAAANKIFNFLMWLCTMRTFEYMSMGFMLLTFHDTTAYWSSIYYCGHVWTATMIVTGYTIKKVFGKGCIKKEY
ncbi:hypothetical protein HELRODRAFT_112207 [Helobdella robusta]|uniref:Lysophospholipid acyltransferase 7 n=1 Tax=Helobdella robusta TaxID=6412 RepID=T1EFH7_HELRO|nr:hypothetical protein HELRODRAFT_112207 [Helobdella robusta]ESO03284.1 hypothetical protein HELRODRAFT_112207 [Helobdella robusta]